MKLLKDGEYLRESTFHDIFKIRQIQTGHWFAVAQLSGFFGCSSFHYSLLKF